MHIPNTHKLIALILTPIPVYSVYIPNTHTLIALCALTIFKHAKILDFCFCPHTEGEREGVGYGRGEKERVWCVREEEEDEYTSSLSGTVEEGGGV